MAYKIHKYCELFPDMSKAEYAELKKGIKENGLQVPIWRWGNYIIDGKNRQSACEDVEAECYYRDWQPKAKDLVGQEKELLNFVMDLNFRRRHLTDSQRAMVAAEIANLNHGGDRKNQEANLPLDPEVTRKEAAEKLGVSPRSVTTAAAVRRDAEPEVVEAVKAGDITVNDASHIKDLTPKKQRAAVKAVQSGKATTATAAAKAEPEETAEAVLDAIKGPVHESLHVVFEECKTFKDCLNRLGSIHNEMEEVANGPAGSRVNFQDIKSSIEQLRILLKFSAPHTECVKCRRKPDKKCTHCKGTGWLTKPEFNGCASDSDKSWLEARS